MERERSKGRWAEGSEKGNRGTSGASEVSASRRSSGACAEREWSKGRWAEGSEKGNRGTSEASEVSASRRTSGACAERSKGASRSNPVATPEDGMAEAATVTVTVTAKDEPTTSLPNGTGLDSTSHVQTFLRVVSKGDKEGEKVGAAASQRGLCAAQSTNPPFLARILPSCRGSRRSSR